MGEQLYCCLDIAISVVLKGVHCVHDDLLVHIDSNWVDRRRRS